MSDVQYESICQKVWAFYEANQAFALQGNGRRNILFPPPRRSRPVDLLVVGMSPNQAAPINYTHTFEGLKAFAHSFRYVSGGNGGAGQHYDPYYLELLRLFRRVDDRFGAWWEVESGKRQLVVEFTDALHVATEPNTDDIARFVSPGVQGGMDRRKLCKEILELELAYYQPKVVIGNGRLPSDLLWEICTGKPVEGSPVECLIRYKPCNSVVHLSGFLTSKSMDAYSKARLLKELKEHSPFVERQHVVETAPITRRRRADSWDDLFEALRWLFTKVHPAWCLLVAAAFFLVPVLWFHYTAQSRELQLLGIMLGAILALVSLAAGVAGWKLRRDRAAFLQQHLDIDWLNKLSWQEFEQQVAEVYRHQGYQVEEAAGGGADGGVDLRLRRDGQTSIVQCKQWRTFKVGVKPVRELFGVMAAEKADRAILITSGVYTEEALGFAHGKPIELVDGAQLAEAFRHVQAALKQPQQPTVASAAPGIQAAPETPARPGCPRCGSEMVLRRAQNGPNAGKEFWGCSMFGKTKCGGIRSVE